MAKLLRGIAVGYLTALIFFGWGWLAVRLEIFPYAQVEPLYQEIHSFFAESHKDSVAEMIALDHQEQALQFPAGGYQVSDPGFKDSGHLLLSRYSKADKQTVVELFSLATGTVVHQWRPDLDAIFRLTPSFNKDINTRIAYRAQHPYLLENGDLLLTSGEGPLVRIDPCGKPVWAISKHFHHSIERMEDGNFVIPVVVKDGDNELGIAMREDGFAIVTPDGEVVKTVSVHQLLLQNGYQGLIFGVGEFEQDRYHVNDVQPVPGHPSEYLLSIRNLSSVARVNIDSGKVLWLKTGPWLNQHDINPLDGGWVSLFGNDLVRSTGKFLNGGHSEVYLYHPETGEIRKPYTSVLQSLGMHTKFEGRVTILTNGDAFVEETNRDRLVRVAPDGLRWQYVNAITPSTSGALHWSRYLEPQQLPKPLMDNLRCETP